jgi:hypothetical protein
MRLTEFFLGASTATPPLGTHHSTHKLAACGVCAALPAVAAAQASTPIPFASN